MAGLSVFDSTAEGSQEFYHLSVLKEEVLHFLAPQKGKIFIDGTLGGGGHSEALLQAGATVKGIDRDADAWGSLPGTLMLLIVVFPFVMTGHLTCGWVSLR